jgi:hypothetical protein|tara:strand:+ start:53 stop:238 length:186 start_codon:yes stop_codon:yes gene_type:complete
MKTLTNNTGSKKVNIITDNGYDTPIFRAFYVQVYNGEEQVLDSKSYSSIKMAEKWGNKKLN